MSRNALHSSYIHLIPLPGPNGCLGLLSAKRLSECRSSLYALQLRNLPRLDVLEGFYCSRQYMQGRWTKSRRFGPLVMNADQIPGGEQLQLDIKWHLWDGLIYVYVPTSPVSSFLRLVESRKKFYRVSFPRNQSGPSGELHIASLLFLHDLFGQIAFKRGGW